MGSHKSIAGREGCETIVEIPVVTIILSCVESLYVEVPTEDVVEVKDVVEVNDVAGVDDVVNRTY